MEALPFPAFTVANSGHQLEGLTSVVHVRQIAIIELPCAVCNRPAARYELVAPGGLRSAWDTWDTSSHSVYLTYRDPTKWKLLYEGITGGNGFGDTIGKDEAEQIAQAFRKPFSYARIRAAGHSDDAG